jgi:hypothetical protein
VVTHYDPYTQPDECPDEKAWCGTILGEECDLTWNWKLVTCKRCLKSKDRIVKEYNHIESDVVKQMGDWADYYKSVTI